MMVTTCATEPTHRVRAILHAVQDGQVEMTSSCEPDLKVSGLLLCDQATARELAHADLVRPMSLGLPGRWVRAELSEAGLAVLEHFLPPAAT